MASPVVRWAALALQLTLAIVLASAADPPPAPAKPKTEGRPVYIAAGTPVVFPENVELAPDDYRGTIGARPLALIKLEGKIVGEIYASRLKGTPAEEAKGMAASPDKNKGVELVKKTTFTHRDRLAEAVTLKFNLPSDLGSPWILHSLYFPQGVESSTTFKLAVAESRFEALLPYLLEMFQLGSADAQRR
jgi:hypothetical protein